MVTWGDCIPTIGEAISWVNSPGKTAYVSGVDINSDNITGIPAALAAGRAADVIVLVLGIDRTIEHEGIDRDDTALPGKQEYFAVQVFNLKKPTILIFCNGGAIAFDDIVDFPDAIIEAYSPSVAGPRALAATLFGLHNKWGKLVTTLYPHSFISENPMTNYDMALSPGRTYKYYTGIPLFPFGYGMSYTTFQMNCTGSQTSKTEYSCMVKNVGQYDGDEVVQVYHSVGDDIRRKIPYSVPMRSLVEFERVTIPVGKTVTVKFRLFDTSLMVVNEVGLPELYPGVHNYIFSRGTGDEIVIPVTAQKGKLGSY